jgi:hypothetical protein
VRLHWQAVHNHHLHGRISRRQYLGRESRELQFSHRDAHNWRFGRWNGSFDWYLSAGPVNQMGHYGGHSMGVVLARHPRFISSIKRLYELSLPIIEKI